MSRVLNVFDLHTCFFRDAGCFGTTFFAVVSLLAGCSLNAPAPDNIQYQVVLGADLTPANFVVNLKKSNFGVGLIPGYLNTESTPNENCSEGQSLRRPGATIIAPSGLSFYFREDRLAGFFVIKEIDQSRVLDILCTYRN